MKDDPVLSQSDIVAGLRKMGLKEGDRVLVHGSLSSFGRVEGGADTLIDALLEVIGKQGTLLMPTFDGDSPFDARHTPTKLGAVPEAFRQRQGVLRSRHPLSSVAAYGPRAAYYVEGHEDAKYPFAEGSPYLKLADDGGYVLLLGVDQDRSTTLHTVEALANAPYLRPAVGKWIDENGETREKEFQRFAGPHRNFIGVDRLLREAGICKVGRIGPCVVRLMKSRALIDFLVPKVRENPDLFLSASHDYWDGVWQRGMVRRSRLAEERFRLVVQCSAAGANMEEVFWEAEGLGVRSLELDVVDGRDVSTFDGDDLGYLLSLIGKRGFEVETVRCRRAGKAAFEACLNAGEVLRAKGVVVPLTGTADSLRHKAEAAARVGLTLYAENLDIGSDEAAELLTAAGDGVALAFDPAGFALVGELPFLASFKNRTIKKRTRYLAVTDVGRDDRSRLPGTGRAEVAELLSILCCQGFDGPLVLTRGPNADFAYHQAGDALWQLLERVGIDRVVQPNDD